jgi:mRNA interferase RelE/StbE
LAFDIRFKKSVRSDLKVLPKPTQSRLLDAIERDLASDPYQGKPLQGEFKGLYRWRVGEFRVICEIQEAAVVVLVLKIGHRKDAYR